MTRKLFAISAAVLCAAPSAAALAQAHDHTSGAKDTLAGWAAGAQLFDGLGGFHRKVTTRSALAQRYFDQGMRLLWAFNHDEATRSFAKAALIDPRCASCFWGVALTLGPNYNMPMMNPARARVGWRALRRAKAVAERATPLERAMIDAVALRYRGTREVDPSNSKPLLAAYVEAMRKIAARYPNDLDVQTMYAEGLMNTNPWKLWTTDGKKNPGTERILERLRYVLARDPKHPGANHYYIHAIEASPDPGQAVASAEVLTGMMPAAGHLEHMPAHIMQRLGRYEEAAEANRKGAAADLAYLKATAAPDYYPMYLIHNFQFLGSAAAMQGRREEAIAALKQAKSQIPDSLLLSMPGLDWSASFIYDGYVKFGMWGAVLAEPAPNPELPGATISFLQSRATALAATGKVDEARRELARSKALIEAVAADAAQGNNSARSIYQIGQLKAEARVAETKSDRAAAIRLLSEAVAVEDTLAYNEPNDMIFPTRHLLGAALLAAGNPATAEAVYRRDLVDHPDNGWAWFGLAQAMQAQGKAAEARDAMKSFARAWKRADVQLASTAF